MGVQVFNLSSFSRQNSIEVKVYAKSIGKETTQLYCHPFEKVVDVKKRIARELGLLDIEDWDLCWAGIRFNDEEDLSYVYSLKANFHILKKISLNNIGSPQCKPGFENLETTWPHIAFV